jgi:hypothetical protein
MFKNNPIQSPTWSQSYDFGIKQFQRRVFYGKEIYLLSWAVNFYNAGVVTQSRRIGSRIKC